MDMPSLQPDDIRYRAAAAGFSIREERIGEVAEEVANNIATLRRVFNPPPLDGVPDDFRVLLTHHD